MSSGLPDIDYSQQIPIFPLPNCVLLPRAILPLHLFEPRYREMAADIVDDHRLVAMALLKPGYEAKYYTHVAAIHPVLCVGRIVRYERLDDGRYNLLLQGVCRAKVRREDKECSYRRGWLVPIPTVNGLAPEDARRIRASFADALNPATLSAVSPTGVLLDVVKCPDLPLSDMLDLLAFDLIGDPAARLKFLEQPDVTQRAAWLTEVLSKVQARCSHPEAAVRRCSRFVSEN